MTVLTLDEAADFLKMTKNQLYTLLRKRSRARMDSPIPVMRINSNVRFCKESLVEWLGKLEDRQ